MKFFLSKAHSDEDGPMAEEGKLGILYSSRSDLLKLCDFFEKVKNELTKEEFSHIHFRDSFDGWNKENHIDIEINIEM